MFGKRVVSMALGLGLVLVFGGCGTFRALPSHGGGKRFDEEQRVVSGAIRQAVADMDLKELQGKRVNVTMNTMAHSACGESWWPGLQDLRVSASDNQSLHDNARRIFREYGALPSANMWMPYSVDNNQTSSDAFSVNASFDTHARLDPYITRTDEDAKYLSGVMGMVIAHWGAVLDPKRPEVTLQILVDVMGTNLSMKDGILFSKQNLRGSCELTYYALDVRTGKLLFPARRVSAVSDYGEVSVLGVNGLRVARSLKQSEPTAFPEIGPHAAEGVEAASQDEATGDDILSSVKAAQRKKAKANGNGKKAEQAKQLATMFNSAKEMVRKHAYERAQVLVNRIRTIDSDYPGLRNLQTQIDEERNNLNGKH